MLANAISISVNNLLDDMVFCKDCGVIYDVLPNGTYTCPECYNAIHIHKLDRIVLDVLDKAILNNDKQAQHTEYNYAFHEALNAERIEQLRQFEIDLMYTDSRLQSMRMMHDVKSVVDFDYYKKLDELNKNKIELTIRIHDLKQQLGYILSELEIKRSIKNLCDLSTKTIAQKKSFVDSYIEYITIHTDKIEINIEDCQPLFVNL